MLDDVPQLTGTLNIQSVPVTYVGPTRIDGPINEWVLAQRLTLQ